MADVSRATCFIERRPWEATELQRLDLLLDQGLERSVIAEALGRSLPAVRTKISRSGKARRRYRKPMKWIKP